MNRCLKWPRSAAALLALGLAACGGNAGSDADGKPGNPQFVVDTGPGGGSDVFARQVVKMALANKIVDQNWPVLSRPQGGGLAAMSFLKQKGKQPDFVAAFTSKWVISGMSTDTPAATVNDLTLIAELADEPQMIAVPSNSPYKTFAEFIAAAKAKPASLVQVGGAYSSVDNLAALRIQQNTGTSWKYLSFADGGPRITALLRGDAQMMIGSQTDFSEQVAAGQLRIIGVLSAKRSAKYPDVSTVKEQGISTEGLPDQLQFRGIAGPPGMDPKTVAYYQGVFAKLVKTPEWQKYMDEEGDITDYVSGPEFTQRVHTFTQSMQPMMALLKKSTQQ